MKTLLTKLVACSVVLFAVVLKAQGVVPGGDFFFPVDKPVSYTYNKQGATDAEKCSEPLVANLVNNVFIVHQYKLFGRGYARKKGETGCFWTFWGWDLAPYYRIRLGN